MSEPSWVNKIDVATRQIRTSVRLVFEEADPIIVHSIVAAAHQILMDLSHHKGTESMVKPPGRNHKIVNAAANFFKHADKDPSGQINIKLLEELNSIFLVDAIVMLQGVTKSLPLEAKIFWSWYMVNREEDFAGAGAAIDSVINSARDMKKMNLKQMRQLLRFQQVLNIDEPLPAWATEFR